MIVFIHIILTLLNICMKFTKFMDLDEVTMYQKIEEVPKNNQFKLFDFLYKFKNHIIKK